MKSVIRDVPFALTFDPAAPALQRDVVSVAWTPELLGILRQINESANKRAKERAERRPVEEEEHEEGEAEQAFVNLPYADLRARMQLRIRDWIWMNDNLGVRKIPKDLKEAAPWAYLESGDPISHAAVIRDVFAEWLEGRLAQFSESRSAHVMGITALRRLSLENRVVQVTSTRVQLFPLGAPTKRGTPGVFELTAGVLAKHLAGREIFPGLGPVVRVLGGAMTNQAEIMTRPHEAAGGRFSLVCELSLQTLPGGARPLVHLKFSRRRWATSFEEKYLASRSIGGFVLPHAARPLDAFRFTVSFKKELKAWTTDLGYEQLEHHLGLLPDYRDAMVGQYPATDAASVLLMYKAKVTVAKKSRLEAGVPLADQAAGFQGVADALKELGFRPFEDIAEVDVSSNAAPKLAVLKAELMLARLMDREGQTTGETMSIDDAVLSATDSPASYWFPSGTPKVRVGDQRDHKLDPKAVSAAIRTLVGDTGFAADNERRTLYVLTQTAADLRWIKDTVDIMFAGAIKVVSAPLPAGTHGAQQMLPLANERKRPRFDARTQAWSRFAATSGIPPRSMVLIEAAMFYTVDGATRKDDTVNKLAARKALAAELGCTVQYLLPFDGAKLEEFLLRVQAAVLDLVFGHAGTVWGLKQACNACFPATAAPPKWVGALTSIVVFDEWKQVQRVMVSTRLECASGTAWVRFAHQDAETVVTGWMRFDEGARYLACRRLAAPKLMDDQRALMADLTIATLDDLAALDPNAAIFIDATRSARWARWLTDAALRSSTNEVAPGIHLSDRWRGLRVFRIRALAPTVGQEKRWLVDDDDTQQVTTWTTTQHLLRVGGTPVPTFWSIAKPIGHYKRGASCYRDMLLPNTRKTPDRPGPIAMAPAEPDEHHATPQAVEVVVLQAQSGDDVAQLATFAHRLRGGMLTTRNDRWVSSPTPLRIIDKLGQYMLA